MRLTALVRGVNIAPNDSLIAFYASDGSVPDELYVGTFAEAPRRLTNAMSPKMKRTSSRWVAAVAK